jgi:hypothetical protein
MLWVFRMLPVLRMPWVFVDVSLLALKSAYPVAFRSE